MAVDGVDLHVDPGEIVGVVGESGSGKTTLGRLLLRLVDPDEGEVRFEGQRLSELEREPLRRLRARMQMVFQGATACLNPRLTVEQHLDETLRLHCPGADRAVVIRETLASLGLSGLGGSRPGQLSGGQKRRVGLARCLLPSPRLLVADEPTAGLDASLQADVLDVLLAAHGPDKAWVFISHELDLVRRVSGRVLVMLAGRVVQELPAERLRPDSDPAELHPYTEHLLQSGFGTDPPPTPVGVRGSSSGCPWAPRCGRVRSDEPLYSTCTRRRPDPVPLGGGRVACHRFSSESS